MRTRKGDFTGFVLWDRKECVGPDELDGHDGELRPALRYHPLHRAPLARQLPGDAARRPRDRALHTPEVGQDNRGIYVDDRRYGRVQISWVAFERIDFSAGGSGPEYGDFPPGRPLTGSVATRAGRRLAGRLVYDLNESETTDTLDAPSQGVDFTIPFGLIASIVPPGR